MLYRLNSTHTIGRRAEVSLGDVLQHVDVERLVGDDPLQTGVLVLEFLEALRVVGLHSAVLVLPAVPGRLVISRCRQISATSRPSLSNFSPSAILRTIYSGVWCFLFTVTSSRSTREHWDSRQPWLSSRDPRMFVPNS